MRSHWECWTLVAYEGAELRLLVEAGAPLRAAISDGREMYPPEPYVPGGPYRKASTARWAAVALRALGDADPVDPRPPRALRGLRLLVADEDLRVALLSSLDLGGADAGEALLRAVVP